MRKIDSVLILVILTITNSFLAQKYFKELKIKGIGMETILYSYLAGLVSSGLLSGNQSLIKSFPLTQIFFLNYIIDSYGIDSLFWVGILSSVFLIMFLGIKLNKFYLLIPRSITIGFRLVLTILFLL